MEGSIAQNGLASKLQTCSQSFRKECRVSLWDYSLSRNYTSCITNQQKCFPNGFKHRCFFSLQKAQNKKGCIMNRPRLSTTFEEVVSRWELERLTTGIVQPYTAAKAAQKARLLCPWIGRTKVDEIKPSNISNAICFLSKTGGRLGKGLSSATLRACHLAGSRAIARRANCCSSMGRW